MKNAGLLKECASFVQNIPENNNYLTPAELKNLLKESPESIYLLDVRPKKIFDKSHIEGAINIFLKDLFTEENIKNSPLIKQ